MNTPNTNQFAATQPAATQPALARATIELPDFSTLSLDILKQQVEQALQQAKQQLQQVPTQFDNTRQALDCIDALDHAENDLQQAWGVLSHLNAVKNSPQLRELYQAILPELSNYYTQLGQHQGLYQAYEIVQSSAEFVQLSTAQQGAIQLAIRDFKLSGVALEGDAKQRYAQISARLSELSSHFSNHVLDATQAWSMPLDDAQLKGLPASSIALLEQLAQQRGQSGALATLDFPAYLAIMTYADERSLRETIYTAYVTRASELGEAQFDNSELMQEILALRQEMAELLGFVNYAEYSLASKMAPSVTEVKQFLLDLADKARQPALAELEQLQQEAKAYAIGQVMPWDTAYLSEKIKLREYNLSQEQLKPYFPAPVVIEGLFKIAEQLYGIQIEQKQAAVWEPDVYYYEVSEHGKVIAGFYFDLYARSNKRGGAWMSGFRSRMKTRTGIQLPVAFMVGNFTPPVGNQPALLTHDELVTLFHEFGHGLHHLLTEVDVIHVAGTHGVAWDAVELPSQFMEFWTWDKQALGLISRHFEHERTLPGELLDALLAARYFQTGIQTLRQLEFALFDLNIHSTVPAPDQHQIQQILDEVRQQVAVLPNIAHNRFQHSFSHIFAGGYAAGYYSYKWAEVLASDAFDRFEQEGLFNKDTGKAFRDAILAVGGSVDALTAFKNFRGREPELAALLRHSGWIDSQPAPVSL
ncbi:M3 family metallopeptidase [Alkanindiges sp. WGS2144]|uniref:M3 family metallopeptidase n=1 Tax=Alkanindiges sp. WGS2144 TaxID=3366808 RepID=UPI003753A9CD